MDVMDIDDNIYGNRRLTMDGLLTEVNFHGKRRPSRCASVCLGLLCAVLLAGNIGQFLYYYKIGRTASGDATQASYNAVTQEKDQLYNDYKLNLQANYTILQRQMQRQYDILKRDNDQLQRSYNTLAHVNRQLQHNYDTVKDSYDTMKKESDQMQANFSFVSRENQQLKTNYSSLITRRDQIQIEYDILKRDNDQLQISYNTLAHGKRQLQDNYDTVKDSYDTMKKESDQMHANFSFVSRENQHLKSNYSSLIAKIQDFATSKQKEIDKFHATIRVSDQMQANFSFLSRENQQLKTNYSSLITRRDQLQREFDKLNGKIRDRPCQSGWSKFESNCYYFSTSKANWTMSREGCKNRGADLVVINSGDEQEFVKGLGASGANAWIGLTDMLIEGSWTWVDGTPITIEYWQPGQPNSYDGNQDCGEMVHNHGQVGTWNDDGCFAEQNWICEK